jgi:outer membrane receptor for ferrienterochelin and colicins
LQITAFFFIFLGFSPDEKRSDKICPKRNKQVTGMNWSIFPLPAAGSTTSVAKAFVLSAFLFFLSVFATANAESSSSATSAGKELILFQEIPSVYGASKYEQKVTEAPSAVTIVTADEIRKYGYRTLADILQSVTGFYVTSDRNYAYLGVRGFDRPGDYNTRVLLLVDGHRLNDNIFDQAPIGTDFPVDVDLIDRVEIIRGPSSSLYGTNAFFAVIDVITKRGRDVKGAEASTEIASYDSYKGRLTYGNRFPNGLELLLSGSFYDSAGHPRLFYKEFDTPTTNHGIAKNADGDRYYSVFANLAYSDFTLLGGYVSREKVIPTASFGTVFNTDRTRTTDERSYIDLKYQRTFAQQLELTARVYYDRYYYQGNYLFAYLGDGVLTLNRDIAVGERWGTEVKVTKRLLEKHLLTLGAEFRDNVRQEQKNYDVFPFSSYLDDHRSSRNCAVYLQDEFSLLENLILNVGARYDYYDSFGGTFNPRLALIYNLPKTTIKLLYGEAFREPNVYEAYYGAGGQLGSDPNPRLKPENITMYEVVVERYFGDHLRGAASAYYYTLDDLISQQINPATGNLIFENSEQVEAKGLELEGEGKWASGVEGHVGYALQEATNQKTGKTLTNSPHHLLKLNLIVPLIGEKVFAGLEARYTSARRTLAGHSTDGFFVTNITVFNQFLLKGLEVSASVYNVFDQHYGDPGAEEHRQDSIAQDGRTFWVKLKYGF